MSVQATTSTTQVETVPPAQDAPSSRIGRLLAQTLQIHESQTAHADAALAQRYANYKTTWAPKRIRELETAAQFFDPRRVVTGRAITSNDRYQQSAVRARAELQQYHTNHPKDLGWQPTAEGRRLSQELWQAEENERWREFAARNGYTSNDPFVNMYNQRPARAFAAFEIQAQQRVKEREAALEQERRRYEELDRQTAATRPHPLPQPSAEQLADLPKLTEENIKQLEQLMEWISQFLPQDGQLAEGLEEEAAGFNPLEEQDLKTLSSKERMELLAIRRQQRLLPQQEVAALQLFLDALKIRLARLKAKLDVCIPQHEASKRRDADTIAKLRFEIEKRRLENEDIRVATVRETAAMTAEINACQARHTAAVAQNAAVVAQINQVG